MENANLVESILETKKVCLFEVDNIFAIDETYLQEVIFIQSITHVPRVSNTLLGLIAARGNILPLFDVSPYLGVTKSSFKQALVIEHESRMLALAVDSVVGLESVEVELHSPSDQTPYFGHFIYQEQEVPLFNFESYISTLDMSVIS